MLWRLGFQIAILILFRVYFIVVGLATGLVLGSVAFPYARCQDSKA